jgi:hypothetical protein
LYKDDADLAKQAGIDPPRIQLLRERRSLTNREILLLSKSPPKFQRALRRARFQDLPALRAAFRALQQKDEHGKVPANAIPRAIQQMQLLRLPADARGGQWRAAPRALVAPNAPAHPPGAAAAAHPPAAAAGVWDWLGPDNIGGRTRSIIIDPTDAQRMWAGSVAGGIWITTNGGGHWEPADDFMASLAISCMVMDPADHNVIYAGTGEAFASWTGVDPAQIGFSPDGIRGAGIFETTDGTNWNQLPSTTTPSFQYVNRLAMAAGGSGHDSILLAATTKGLFKSSKRTRDDWGLPVLPSGTITDPDIADVDFAPADATKVIAGSRLNGQAYYSEQGGDRGTWHVASHAAPWTGRVELAYAAADPKVVYALTNTQVVDPNSGQSSRLSKIYRSSDGGKSYVEKQTLTRDENNSNVDIQADPLGSQGDYDNVIWAGHPTDPDFVIVGGIDLWRSRDGGDHLEKISAWYESPPSAHADHHVIVAHPKFDGTNNKTVFFGNDGGLYVADDIFTVGGNQPNPDPNRVHLHVLGWKNLNNGYGVTQFYGAIANHNTGILFGGAQDNGTLRFDPTQSTHAWTTVIGGDGGYCASDPTPTGPGRKTFYSEYVYADIQRSVNAGVGDASGNPDSASISGHFWNTTTQQWEWKTAPYVIEDARDSDLNQTNPSANFIAPFALDPNNVNCILIGGLRLWRTNDPQTPNNDALGTGPRWTAIKPQIGSVGFVNSISAIAVQPGNSDVIWVAHNNGNVYKTVNGTSPTPIWIPMDRNSNGTSGLPRRFCTRIIIDPSNVNRIYATFGGFSASNVFTKIDGQTDWTDIGASLPQAPVRALAIHPDHPGYLYVGTEVGILISHNAGAQWLAGNQGPTNCSVDELFWVNKTLFAVTHGRGVYSLDQSNVP